MVKKITEIKKTPSDKKQVNKDWKESKKNSVAVIQKSTQPKVVVETKSLKKEKETPNPLIEERIKKNKKLWKILGWIVAFLTIVNFILLWYGISIIREQKEFNIASHGGIENYTMLKELYSTIEFQQLSASNTYKLIEQVNQISQQ